MCLTSLPPQICLIRKKEIGDKRASASCEWLDFRKSFPFRVLFSRVKR